MRYSRFNTAGLEVPGYDVITSKDVRQSLFDINDFGSPSSPNTLTTSPPTPSNPVPTSKVAHFAAAAAVQAGGNIASSLAGGALGFFGNRERISSDQLINERNLQFSRSGLNQQEYQFSRNLAFNKTQFGESIRRFNADLNLSHQGLNLQREQFQAALQSAKSLGVAYGQTTNSPSFATARLGGIQRTVGNRRGPRGQ